MNTKVNNYNDLNNHVYPKLNPLHSRKSKFKQAAVPFRNVYRGKNDNNAIDSGVMGRINNEAGLNYEERRTIDLVQQVLNSRLNILQENRNISDLFRTYGNVLKDRMPLDFTSSMRTSGDSIFNVDFQKNAISQLQPENPNSFLIVPILVERHVMAGVIRNVGEDNHTPGDNFSLTVVNKGSRDPRTTQPFMEYLMKKEKLTDVLEKLHQEKILPIPTAYNLFASKSHQRYSLNISSRNQKVGNCFIKEPENAIKFAVNSSTYTKENIASFRTRNLISKSKWDIPTDEMHKQFVFSLMKENPSISQRLASEYNTYLNNKTFRKQLAQSVEPNIALKSGFDPYSKTQLSNDKSITKQLLSQINYDTAMQLTKPVLDLISSTNDLDYKNTFTKLYKLGMDSHSLFASMVLSENSNSQVHLIPRVTPRENDYSTRPYFATVEPNVKVKSPLLTFLDKAEISFPNVTGQIKLDLHMGYFMSGITLAQKGKIDKCLDLIGLSIDIYPTNSITFAYRGLVHAAMGNKEKALLDEYHALSLNPNDKLAKDILDKLLKENGVQKIHSSFPTITKKLIENIRLNYDSMSNDKAIDNNAIDNNKFLDTKSVDNIKKNKTTKPVSRLYLNERQSTKENSSKHEKSFSM